MTVVARAEAPDLAFPEHPGAAFGRLAELAARACDVVQQAQVENQISAVVTRLRLRAEVGAGDGWPIPLDAVIPLLAAAANTSRPLPQRVTVLARLYALLDAM